MARALQSIRLNLLVRHAETYSCLKLLHRNLKTRAWEIFNYGGSEQLKLSSDVEIGAIRSASDVLVEVHASSINPFDIAMLSGYGSNTLAAMQKLSCGMSGGAKSLSDFPQILSEMAKIPFADATQFPITLGRDFSGVVKATGEKAAEYYKPGDEVFGVVNPLKTSLGAHSEYTVVSTEDLASKPKTLSHIEAASFPYVTCTAWASIAVFGNLSQSEARNKRVLILGGSGGVGTFAIQLLKCWGADVTTTCATDAVNQLLTLGADTAIDYKQHDAVSELQKVDKFDLILDCVKVVDGSKNLEELMLLLKPNCSSHYVDLNSPLLRNNDSLGFPFGFAKSFLEFTPTAVSYAKDGKQYRWGFYMPNKKALKSVADLVDEGKIQPKVEKVYKFDEVPAAFDKVSSGHNRGKTVIEVKSL